MSFHQPPRRRFLRQTIAIVPAVPVAALGLSACTEAPRESTTATHAAYAPVFFTPAEWQFVCAAVDRLIPADALGPGALASGIPEFIDRQMETPFGHGQLWYMQGPFHPEQPPELGYQLSLTPRDIYRHGIRACDAWCAARYRGRPFARLDGKTQDAVLTSLERGEVEFDAVPASTFFSTLLDNTKEGYWADPVYGGNRGMASWKLIGFPGARADFADWIGRPGEPYPHGPVSLDGSRG
ncbi:gluconate 2-dehydrogenase subunit 3 family protein [Burkholderia multivorans]|uniref:gluconate 2-dehydrogenase subunit 3 family protein n=1 Tax=Burkholderia multivorans TaxID=87883 RepID=UPI001C22385F|nr:gluconate 2-dehydrogenase subunit 3 family protein [Burkholderia multivorans]MBU9436475.1 gluconate 2-dehydrogenase subunit 3 family protein [Burkholderia multivorans]